MKTPQFVQLHHEDRHAIREELIRGLTEPLARASPKYLYDALGSKLFEAITELPEYYPTRTEAAIFAEHGAAMADAIPQAACLIDLGAGNCVKAANLFGRLHPSRYVAVDISVEFLRNALDCLQRQFPALDMLGLGMDFSSGLHLPPAACPPDDVPRVLFYPGSSIGNFTPQDALEFLRSVHKACGPHPCGGLLIGVDLVKSARELEAAYDDALGVTAAFNRNLLLHINRLIGTDFAIGQWEHLAIYNSACSRIEMHLQARHTLELNWPGGHRRFVAGERIHTENSCKWTVQGFGDLLAQAGFARCQPWLDKDQRFAVFWAGVTDRKPE
jgi:L-histidine Nalpha-methyltransferase